MTRLSLSGVSVSFDGTRVVDGVSLSVDPGRWLGLIGPNGAGKSTLLRAIAGLVRFTGTITLDGSDIGTLTRRAIARLIAVVPQQPFVPRAMAVIDYLLMGRTPYIAYLGSETHDDLVVVGQVLEQLGLADLGDRALGSLSGGELQRVLLGRALAQQAPVLLLDEPTSALDIGHQQQVLELVDELRRTTDLTVISAMHDLTLAGQFTDSLAMLVGGQVVAAGSAREVFTEEALRVHYGAHVRVIQDPDGTVTVTPARVRSGLVAGSDLGG